MLPSPVYGVLPSGLVIDSPPVFSRLSFSTASKLLRAFGLPAPLSDVLMLIVNVVDSEPACCVMSWRS